MPAGTDVVVGRQGIYDSDHLIGYELIFGSVGAADGAAVTGDEMTAAVMFGAVTIGLNHLVGDRMVFCNGDRGVITGEIPVLLPAHRTVIQVVGNLEVDDEVVAGCARLVKDGYTLALADFVWGSGQEKLLPLASIVKVNVVMAMEAELTDLVELCQGYDVRMLAQNMNELNDVAHLTSLGFELFQGVALDRPQTVRGHALDPEVASGVLAAAELLNTEPDFDHIEEILKRDPGLTYQIMMLASIGRLGEPRRYISTIREALVLAGTRRISNWLALLLARPAKPGTRAHDAYLATLVRARACELLAAGLTPPQPGLGFAAGLLSALDYLLEQPLDEIAANLPLSDELHAAAFGGEGPVADLVLDARAYQLGTAPTGMHSNLAQEDFDAAFARAFTWAVESAAVTETDEAPTRV
jgi:EAL and modified HD-GYP domain-containing signal transduction protein